MAAKPAKVLLFEMVLWAMNRADHLDAWRSLLHSEGTEFPEYLERELVVARQAQKSLEVIMMFEAPIRLLVAGEMEARRRAARIRRDDAEEQKIEQIEMGVPVG